MISHCRKHHEIASISWKVIPVFLGDQLGGIGKQLGIAFFQAACLVEDDSQGVNLAVIPTDLYSII